MHGAMHSNAKTKFIAVKCKLLPAQSLHFLKATTKTSEIPLSSQQTGTLRQIQ